MVWRNLPDGLCCMFGTMNGWTGGPLGWGFAVGALMVIYLVAWRQYREGRMRHRRDRMRERQRREYWGWE